MTGPAIEVTGLGKLFRQYHERNQSLKAAVLRLQQRLPAID